MTCRRATRPAATETTNVDRLDRWADPDRLKVSMLTVGC